MSGDAVIGLIGAFGLGSFVTNLAQNILTRRQRIHDRNFEEKKAAYLDYWRPIIWPRSNAPK